MRLLPLLRNRLKKLVQKTSSQLCRSRRRPRNVTKHPMRRIGFRVYRPGLPLRLPMGELLYRSNHGL